MLTLLWTVAWLFGLGALAYHRVSLYLSTALIGVALLGTTYYSLFPTLILLVMWVAYISLSVLFNNTEQRKKHVTAPLMSTIGSSMPKVSETERAALEAGDTWWEAEWFKGKPDWAHFQSIGKITLSEEENAFLEGPVEQACRMADDWDITHNRYDLPPELWDFLKKEGFFALIIPKEFGGKGFSAAAHAQIVTKLASRSVTLSTTVAVPNTLGPAELLLEYGTPEQKAYYLPRLAKGEEIPAFALTGPEAGSDASSIPDFGTVCKQTIDGEMVLGVKLSWNKRYITLAPVATVLGLAAKVYDPDHLLGETTECGITCFLLPTSTPGVEIGRRHLPAAAPFMNGPTSGKDVFIPLDCVIGGPKQIGHGWQMLMECLSVGRGITLPSSSVGGSKFGVLVTGAYSRIRKQFKTSICEFEGIKEVLARVAGFTYLAEATRLLTVSAIDVPLKPAVASAISKYNVTALARQVAIDVSDIHAGKGVMMGPRNYIARAYQSCPISITVEGANILTRNVIIFGQGAIRCHPYLKDEIDAVGENDLDKFDKLLGQHVGHTLSNVAGSFWHAISKARFAAHPQTNVPRRYQQLTQAGHAFALISDAALLIVGGKIKIKENLSARLGDLLSYLYMGSAALKLYSEQGEPTEDRPLVEWACLWCLGQFWRTFDDILVNFPNQWMARALRVAAMPLGTPVTLPEDRLSQKVAALLSGQTGTRRRLVAGMYDWEKPGTEANDLEQALQDVLAAEPIEKRIALAQKEGRINGRNESEVLVDAQQKSIVTPEEADMVAKAQASRAFVIAVDDFAPESLGAQKQPSALKEYQGGSQTH
jgi:acyl-CoA dehydrogenase